MVDPVRSRNIQQGLNLSSTFLDPVEGLTPYIYTRLDRGNIRLGVMEVGSTDKSVTCDIIAFPLVAAPPYDAVSYCWNSDNRNHALAVGTDRRPKLEITQSVHNVSQHMAPQRDSEDKLHQVVMMRDVYSGATRVCGYLEVNADATVRPKNLQILSALLVMARSHFMKQLCPRSQGIRDGGGLCMAWSSTDSSTDDGSFKSMFWLGGMPFS